MIEIFNYWHQLKSGIFLQFWLTWISINCIVEKNFTWLYSNANIMRKWSCICMCSTHIWFRSRREKEKKRRKKVSTATSNSRPHFTWKVFDVSSRNQYIYMIYQTKIFGLYTDKAIAFTLEFFFLQFLHSLLTLLTTNTIFRRCVSF